MWPSSEKGRPLGSRAKHQLGGGLGVVAIFAATEGAEWMSITSRIKGSANGESDPVEDFLKILVACHTVIPEMMPDGKIVYQAASPDEGALVDAVKQMGFEFKAATTLDGDEVKVVNPPPPP